VMGLGSLGAYVAQKLADWGFVVSGWSRTPKTLEGIACHDGAEQFPAFVAENNILVCLLPETPLTRGLLTHDVFSALRRPSGLVNVARGPLVVEADLLRALEDGSLDGAVLDVFDHEPLPETSPLWQAPRTIITPHVASEASREARVAQVVATIAALERGENVALRYDPQRGY
ncbi:MAG: NAD(P)-dependent oxidoreductase, partial [Acetobacter sp.]